MGPTLRSAAASALAVLLAAAAGPAADGEARAQETVRTSGVEAEASFLGTTLVGGAFPHDETGLGAALGLHHRWPSGVSVGAGAFEAHPEDLDLPGDDLRRAMRQHGVFGEVRYALAQQVPVRPYLGARFGWTRLTREERDAEGTGFLYGLTAGAHVRATDRFGLRLAGAAGGLSVSDFITERTTGAQWTLEAGVSVFLGEVARDEDGDGVRDGEDRCPSTPRGATVDADGCAVDDDGDGVPDHRDACLDTPAGASVDGRGCALDEDRDGVPDGIDECPDTPRGADVDERGCPADADGDGVPDASDRCPDTPADTPVGEDGCAEDDDADGVPNDADRCPGTRYLDEVDREGCDPVEAGLRDEGRFAVDRLPFEYEAAFDEIRLLEGFEPIVEALGQHLVNDPDARVEVRVFTDRVGRPDYSERQSRRMAETIGAHLEATFPDLSPGRVETVGYGEGDPPDGAPGGERPRVEFIRVDGDGGAEGEGARR